MVAPLPVYRARSQRLLSLALALLVCPFRLPLRLLGWASTAAVAGLNLHKGDVESTHSLQQLCGWGQQSSVGGQAHAPPQTKNANGSVAESGRWVRRRALQSLIQVGVVCEWRDSSLYLSSCLALEQVSGASALPCSGWPHRKAPCGATLAAQPSRFRKFRACLLLLQAPRNVIDHDHLPCHIQLLPGLPLGAWREQGQGPCELATSRDGAARPMRRC
mgnify:CR=1 FL=1